MKESRFITVHDRIVNLHDLRRLAEIVVGLSVPKTAKGQSEPALSFIASCADGSTFESEKTDIFADTSPITSKRVLAVDMELFSYETKSFVKIELRHGSSDNYNRISVRGLDATWVNGTLKKLEEAIDSFALQQNFVKTWAPLLRPVFAFSLGILIFQLLDFIIPNPTPDPNPPHWVEVIHQNIFALFCIRYALDYVMGATPAFMLHHHLASYWPSVEFQVGPPHTHFERNRRLWMANAFLLGVLPVISSLIYDLVKTYLFR